MLLRSSFIAHNLVQGLSIILWERISLYLRHRICLCKLLNPRWYNGLLPSCMVPLLLFNIFFYWVSLVFLTQSIHPLLQEWVIVVRTARILDLYSLKLIGWSHSPHGRFKTILFFNLHHFRIVKGHMCSAMTQITGFWLHNCIVGLGYRILMVSMGPAVGI